MNRKPLLCFKIFTLAIIYLSGCTSSEQGMTFPGADWELASAESQDVDESIMLEALDFLKNKSFDDGNEEVMIIRNGRLIYAGDSIDKKHNIWSCSKSFTSTALGLMVHEGMVKLDDPVCQYEPLLEQEYSKVTFRHLATMTSGYNAVGDSRWNEGSKDWSWTPYEPGDPIFEPGMQYAYWDEAMMMKGRILTKILGQSIHSYLSERLTSKIQFDEWEWYTEGEINGIPVNNGCTNVIINAKQLARFGHLYLNNGLWGNERIIPEPWVEIATTIQVPEDIPVADTDRKNAKGSGAYGFNWWVNGGLSAMPDAPPKTYYASGLNHNVCFVIPEWNMVIVRMGVDGNPPDGKHVLWNDFLKILGKGVS